MEKLNLYIIDTGQPVYLDQCLKSLQATTKLTNYILTIVPELEIREKTLNVTVTILLKVRGLEDI